jgi:AcrR family transcriptional regulator
MTGRLRGRPKFEDVAEIEDRLLSVALSEFVQEGYGGASMSNIVKAAGVSKTTLYSRYSSKEALFRAIMHQQIDQLGLIGFLRPQTGKPDLERGLKAYANGALEYSLRGGWLDINRLIYSESRRFPELGGAAAESIRVGVGHICDFIRRCAVADDIPCKDPERVAEAFILMLRGWYVNVMLYNHHVPAADRENWVEGAVRLLIAGREAW